MKVALKELRETQVNMRIILKSGLSANIELNKNMIEECNQLFAIFVKSLETVKIIQLGIRF